MHSSFFNFIRTVHSKGWHLYGVPSAALWRKGRQILPDRELEVTRSLATGKPHSQQTTARTIDGTSLPYHSAGLVSSDIYFFFLYFLFPTYQSDCLIPGLFPVFQGTFRIASHVIDISAMFQDHVTAIFIIFIAHLCRDAPRHIPPLTNNIHACIEIGGIVRLGFHCLVAHLFPPCPVAALHGKIICVVIQGTDV